MDYNYQREAARLRSVRSSGTPLAAQLVEKLNKSGRKAKSFSDGTQGQFSKGDMQIEFWGDDSRSIKVSISIGDTTFKSANQAYDYIEGIIKTRENAR